MPQAAAAGSRARCAGSPAWSRTTATASTSSRRSRPCARRCGGPRRRSSRITSAHCVEHAIAQRQQARAAAQGQRADGGAGPQRPIAVTLNRISCRASSAPWPSAASLATAMSRRIGAMPQLVPAMIFSFGDVFHRLADHGGDLLGRLDLVGRDVDHADLHVLAVEQRQQAHRHPRVAAFDRDLIDPALRQRRKDLLVLPPFAAERRLPVDIGLDAVAVADVDGGGAGEPLDRAVQRLDAPVRRPRAM